MKTALCPHLSAEGGFKEKTRNDDPFSRYRPVSRGPALSRVNKTRMEAIGERPRIYLRKLMSVPDNHTFAVRCIEGGMEVLETAGGSYLRSPVIILKMKCFRCFVLFRFFVWIKMLISFARIGLVFPK